MSVTRKIVAGARSGLNSLLDKVLADDTPLSGVERDELDAEQARRIEARRQGGHKAPEENPRARWAGPGEEAARQRRKAADVREQRIRAVRAEKRKAEEAAREDAWQRLQEDARRQAASDAARAGATGRSAGGASSAGAAGSGARPGARTSSTGAGSGSARRPGGFGRNDKIAKYYKVLDLPYGADFEQVKAAYRKLMRKYHPDLHTQSPQKAKAATELSMQVTQAYNELEIHLIGSTNKKS
jgi:DnaJ-domain-containing protein 1